MGVERTLGEHAARTTAHGIRDAAELQVRNEQDRGLAQAHKAAARCKAGLGRFDVLCVGNSISDGGVATNQQKRWMDLLCRTMQAAYNPDSRGSEPYRPVFHVNYIPNTSWGNNPGTGSVTDNGSTSSFGGPGLGARSWTLSGDATATFQSNAPSDGVVIFFWKSPFTTQISIAIDGGAPTVIDTYNATLFLEGWHEFTGLSNGLHTIVVSAVVGGGNPSPTPSVVLAGCKPIKGDMACGVHFWDAAHASAQTGDVMGAPWLVDPALVGYIQPSLVILELGINDAIRPTIRNKVVMRNNLKFLADRISAHCTTPPSFLVTIPPGVNNADPTWAAFQKQLKLLCIEEDWVWADVAAKLGDNMDAAYTVDFTHPNDAGHVVWHNAIAEVILSTGPPPVSRYPALTAASLGDPDQMAPYMVWALGNGGILGVNNRTVTQTPFATFAIGGTTAPLATWWNGFNLLAFVSGEGGIVGTTMLATAAQAIFSDGETILRDSSMISVLVAADHVVHLPDVVGPPALPAGYECEILSVGTGISTITPDATVGIEGGAVGVGKAIPLHTSVKFRYWGSVLGWYTSGQGRGTYGG